MAIDNKYGPVSVPGIPDDEPVFILRAQDAFALPLLLHYQMMIQGLDRPDDRMVGGMRWVLNAFRKWPKRKIPD